MDAFKKALQAEKPLQIIGVSNAYVALMAKESGFKALYLSGAGVANSCFGVPDIGITRKEDVAEEARRICRAVDLPLLVDIDTGFEAVKETVKMMQQAGAAAIQIEDQIFNKRCGHLDGKQVVASAAMCKRIEEAKTSGLTVVARSDALAIEGLSETIQRAKAYEDAGADAFFAEAFQSLEQYTELKRYIRIPILANMTEFGKTPLFELEELKLAGVDMVLYPLSAARAMNQAALRALREIRAKGTQKGIVEEMQTRNELYRFLNYEGVQK